VGEIVFDGRAHVLDPVGAEQATQADRTVAPEGVDLGIGDSGKGVGVHGGLRAGLWRCAQAYAGRRRTSVRPDAD
jgi:hypothetical protein